MSIDPAELARLQQAFNELSKRQQAVTSEMWELKQQIDNLSKLQAEDKATKEQVSTPLPEIVIVEDAKPVMHIEPEPSKIQHVQQPQEQGKSTLKPEAKNSANTFEQFVGKNLMNKVGILVLLIGIGLGTKYSIDHNLISPLARIILGYLAGIGLLFTGYRLRSKLVNLSAVLTGGGISALFFVTYVAYSNYGFIPIEAAFLLMLVFMIFAVVASIWYDKPVLANLGLVGSYAIPFMLSTGNNNYLFLFTYMTIVNTGVAAVSVRKNWRSLQILASVATWMIFTMWYFTEYAYEIHFTLAISFSTIFFLINYFSLVAYRLKESLPFYFTDAVFIVVNHFIYFAIGFGIISSQHFTEPILGLFTLANSLPHLLVAYIIRKREKVDMRHLYLSGGLVLTFLTLTIPVQLNNEWITLFWVLESTLLMWLATKTKVKQFGYTSVVVAVLAFFSIMIDWFDAQMLYQWNDQPMPVTFPNWLYGIGLIFAAALLVNHMLIKRSSDMPDKLLRFIGTYIFPLFSLLIFYIVHANEISIYWDMIQYRTELPWEVVENGQYTTTTDYGCSAWKRIWNTGLLLIIGTVLLIINRVRLKNSFVWGVASLVVALGLFMFISEAIPSMWDLQHQLAAYTRDEIPWKYGSEIFIGRYVLFFLVILSLVFTANQKVFIENPASRVVHDIVTHLIWIIILSVDLALWFEFQGWNNAYKAGWSVLWGGYAVWLIVQGIRKSAQHLRIAGIVLFAITLIKAFFYDLSSMDTLKKTIVFVILGVILLGVSYLYNKTRIFNNDEK